MSSNDLSLNILESDVTDMETSIIIPAVSSLDSLAVRSVTWDRVRTATASDNSMNELINFIESGIPEFRHEFPPPWVRRCYPITMIASGS
jgi:hypothetical protein